MCGGSKRDLHPFDMEMEGRSGSISHKSCSKLLELAATDDLGGFIHEVEEKGIDVNECRFWYGRSFGSKKMGFEERTPIMIASLYGSTQVLNYIVNTCKVDVNKACGSDGATALHCAAAGGAWSSVEVVELLIAASGDINAVDANGKKPSELIAPCVKSSSSSKRRTLEVILHGGAPADEVAEGSSDEEWCKKKEYSIPVDVSLPDINTGVYGSDEFRMYNFKVKPCSRAYSHDWTECPFVHPGENARRRDPRKYNYTCVPCPEFKKGSCTKGDACEFAHGVFESWLHPAQYRTRLCKDEIGCARKVCFFAHRPEELRPLYASTGSAMPSPKSFSASLDLGAALSPLSLGSSPMSAPSSPMWQSKVNATPPALQLPSSRLKASLTARDMDLGLDEMVGLCSSPYSRAGDLKPTNLDEFFGSLDPSMLSHLSSPKVTNTSHLRASYPSNNASSSPARYGYDSSAAVAVAVMNARSSAFSKRSQSFVDRGGVGYRSNPMQQQQHLPKMANWGSPDGKLEWGFNGEDASKLRKSASFGIRGGGAVNSPSLEEVRWVNSQLWIDQMYMEQEQMVA